MSDHPKIVDRCPSCGSQTLFIGEGGYLTCSLIGCPDPCVAKVVKRLGDELEATADKLSDCWLFLDDIARAENGAPVGDVPLFAKLQAQRILRRQKAPGWKGGRDESAT